MLRSVPYSFGVGSLIRRLTRRSGKTDDIDHQRAADYAAEVDYQQIITIEPGKRSGKPCIRGLRITVQDVLEYLAGGMSEKEFLADFSELTREDIRASLAFAADHGVQNS